MNVTRKATRAQMAEVKNRFWLRSIRLGSIFSPF